MAIDRFCSSSARRTSFGW